MFPGAPDQRGAGLVLAAAADCREGCRGLAEPVPLPSTDSVSLVPLSQFQFQKLLALALFALPNNVSFIFFLFYFAGRTSLK